MTSDWTFARRPFWIFSHAFAASVIILFITLGFWQLDRHRTRSDENARIVLRTEEAIAVDGTTLMGEAGLDPEELEYQAVRLDGRFVDGDFVRVGNRTQGGVAGEHVVAVFELADGTELAVNRGFVPSNADVEVAPAPAGPVTIDGWLRRRVERGFIGATDSGEGEVLPRLDTERVAFRWGRPLPALWLQQAPAEAAAVRDFPDPVPLPPLTAGPHRSYAVQWFIFATLGVLFYGALVRRRSRGDDRTVAVDQPV